MKKQLVFNELIENAQSTKDKIFYSSVFLFSTKGYSNVGIRQICQSVNIKGASFYNHFSSKMELLNYILAYFDTINSKIIFTDSEINKIIADGDIEQFFFVNMQKFSKLTNDPLYLTILQIVMSEKFVHEEVFKIARQNLYEIRKEYTEKILTGFQKKGIIKPMDIELITAEYYYGLIGLLDEYLLNEVWESDLSEIESKIQKHIQFFIHLLKKDNNH